MNRSKLLELVISIFIYSLIVVTFLGMLKNLDLKNKIDNIQNRDTLLQQFLEN